MKILLHTCCGPCSIQPIRYLRDEGFSVMGFYYRHNIHPYTECMKREETLKEYADEISLKMIWQEGYELEEFLRKTAFREANRCITCYHDRLTATARLARKGKFDYYTSSLLYSKFQNHSLIREIGEAVGKKYGIKFYYHDFRDGWKAGIEESKERNMYRQQYCGCIYSEKERYVQG